MSDVQKVKLLIIVAVMMGGVMGMLSGVVGIIVAGISMAVAMRVWRDDSRT